MLTRSSLLTLDSVAWLCASFLLSALLTWVALHYARRINLLDQPGQRRSHTQPTPRGGGIGIVLAVVAGLVALALLQHDAAIPSRLIFAICAIAAVGWIDDHRPLPALVRILVHLVAIVVWLWPLIAGAWGMQGADGGHRVQSFEVVALLVFVCLWSVNLHNFMDGIDGLLSVQVIFVLAVLGVLCLRDPHTPHGFQVLLWAAAAIGFLPFNFPHARIFMGDVGSGTLGLLVAVAAIWQFSTLGSAASSALLAVSAFLTDATCTLVSRLFSGRDWYQAHREHLYQWMVRAGMTHRRVVAWYTGWNVLIVLPLIAWLNQAPGATVSSTEAGAVLWLYIAAVIVWICGKRWCLHKVRNQPGHA